MTLCPGRITGRERFDIVALDFGSEASGSGSLYGTFGNLVEINGSAALGFKAEANLGLAVKIDKVGEKCVDVLLLGSANAKAIGNFYLQGRGYIKYGNWEMPLFDFKRGYKDKVLGHGGFEDSPIWQHQFCL